jgi:hypothetical protein
MSSIGGGGSVAPGATVCMTGVMGVGGGVSRVEGSSTCVVAGAIYSGNTCAVVLREAVMSCSKLGVAVSIVGCCTVKLGIIFRAVVSVSMSVDGSML